MTKPNIQNLLAKFAAQEDTFLRREFLAPKLRGDGVNVRIGGALCRMRVHPGRYEGFGVFKPKSHTVAEYVREATLAERSRYLELLPRVKLIIQGRNATQWLGASATRSDERFRLEGVVPIRFAYDVQLFDIVNVRFDLNRFWFEELDMTQSPLVAAALRTALDAGVDPIELKVQGATRELRDAYSASYRARYEDAPQNVAASSNRVQLSTDVVRNRLAINLSHAGAELVDYAEHSDGYRVTYKVDGNEHVSSIEKNDLTIQSAGFCLDEMDRDFDLASLVGVVREGRQSGELYEGD